MRKMLARITKVFCELQIYSDWVCNKYVRASAKAIGTLLKAWQRRFHESGATNTYWNTVKSAILEGAAREEVRMRWHQLVRLPSIYRYIFFCRSVEIWRLFVTWSMCRVILRRGSGRGDILTRANRLVFGFQCKEWEEISLSAELSCS